MSGKSTVQTIFLIFSFIITVLLFLLDMNMTISHAHEPGHVITYKDYLLDIPTITVIILIIGIINLISIFRKKASEITVIWYGLQFVSILLIVSIAVFDFSFGNFFQIIGWTIIPLFITGTILYIEYKLLNVEV